MSAIFSRRLTDRAAPAPIRGGRRPDLAVAPPDRSAGAGGVHGEHGTGRPPLARSAHPPTPLSDVAVRLALRLRASLSGSSSAVVFTGLAEREGVSRTTAEVALALATGSEAPVLLLDGNFRAPSLHTRFGLSRIPGLSDVVEKRASLDEAVAVSPQPSLFVLPAGRPVPHGLATLSAAECVRVLSELRERFRMVVIDCAPLGRFADGAVLAAQADGVVVVAESGRHRKSELRGLKEELDALGARTLGVLLSEREGGTPR
jgi:protein-tyrosine kinase